MALLPLIFPSTECGLAYAYSSFAVFLFGTLTSYWWNYRQVLISADQKNYKLHPWMHFVRYAVMALQIFFLQIVGSQAKHVYISEQGLYYYRRSRKDSYTYQYDYGKHMDLFYAHAAIFECFSMYPGMTTEKVLAFTRLFRRLIIARQTAENANISIPYLRIKTINKIY